MNEMSKLFSYEGKQITFRMEDGTLMVNATEMGKSFGKRPKNWLCLSSTKEFIKVVTEGRKMPLGKLVIVFYGGNSSGTWFHEDVALEYARWLSPKFALWCNDRMKELMTEGVTSIDGSVNQMLLNVCKKLDMAADVIQNVVDNFSELAKKQISSSNVPDDFMSIRKYCIEHRVSAPKNLALYFGKKCSALCNERGIKPVKIPDDIYPFVNTYPVDILKEVIK